MTDATLSPPPAATSPGPEFEARLFGSRDVTVGSFLLLTPAVALVGWLVGPVPSLVSALLLLAAAVRRLLVPRRVGLRVDGGELRRSDGTAWPLAALTAVRGREPGSRLPVVSLRRAAAEEDEAPLLKLTERARGVDGETYEVADLASVWLLLRASGMSTRDEREPDEARALATAGGPGGAGGADAAPAGSAPTPAGGAGTSPRRRWRNLAIQAVLLALAVLAYALVFDWRLGLAIVAALLVHELGHLAVMRAHGFPVHGIYFVPLLGAVAAMQQRTFARASRARLRIALAGPLVGGLVAAAVWATGPEHHGWPWTFAAVSAVLNLFNLLPAPPLDGSHVADGVLAALHERIPGSTAPTLLIVGSAVPVVLLDPPLLRAFFLALAVAYVGSVRRRHVAQAEARDLERAGVTPTERAEARRWFGRRRNAPLVVDGPPPDDDPVMTEVSAIGYGLLTFALAGGLVWIVWAAMLEHRAAG